MITRGVATKDTMITRGVSTKNTIKHAVGHGDHDDPRGG